jgi:hypothetical protein
MVKIWDMMKKGSPATTLNTNVQVSPAEFTVKGQISLPPSYSAGSPVTLSFQPDVTNPNYQPNYIRTETGKTNLVKRIFVTSSLTIDGELSFKVNGDVQKYKLAPINQTIGTLHTAQSGQLFEATENQHIEAYFAGYDDNTSTTNTVVEDVYFVIKSIPNGYHGVV